MQDRAGPIPVKLPQNARGLRDLSGSTLLDIAPDLLEIAAERARRAHLANVTTRMTDALALPFLDESFDRVTQALCLYHDGRSVNVPIDEFSRAASRTVLSGSACPRRLSPHGACE